MNTRNRIHHLLESDASMSEWWSDMTHSQHLKYLQSHPGSKFKKYVSELPAKTQHKIHRLAENSKKALSDWHEKSPKDKLRSVHKGIKSVGADVVHHGKHFLKHEAEMYKGASVALAHLTKGKKWSELDDEHKKALKKAIIHAGISAGSVALGDATGGSGNAVAHLVAAFTHEHAHHAALFGAGHVAKGLGVDALKKATAAEVPANVEQEVKRLIALMIKADIPPEEWAEIIAEIEKSQAKAKKFN